MCMRFFRWPIDRIAWSWLKRRLRPGFTYTRISYQRHIHSQCGQASSKMRKPTLQQWQYCCCLFQVHVPDMDVLLYSSLSILFGVYYSSWRRPRGHVRVLLAVGRRYCPTAHRFFKNTFGSPITFRLDCYNTPEQFVSYYVRPIFTYMVKTKFKVLQLLTSYILFHITACRPLC